MSDPFLAKPPHPGNIVFDLDGVVFLGTDAIPGAGEALTAIAERGINVVFATNNATKTTAHIAERIEFLTGFSPAPDRIATSATSAAAELGPEDDPILVIGEVGLTSTLTAAGRNLTDSPSAHSVVVGLDRAISYDKLQRAATAIRNGARFVATNTDVTFPMPDGPVPGAGTIVAAVVAASGRQPEIMGKPHPAMIRHVARQLVPGPTWMVGDRAETDVAFGQAAGWTTVLTLSGIVLRVDEVPDHLRPDIVIDSIADLDGLLDQ